MHLIFLATKFVFLVFSHIFIEKGYNSLLATRIGYKMEVNLVKNTASCITMMLPNTDPFIESTQLLWKSFILFMDQA